LDGHHEHFVIGLDGVERFAPDTLVNLPTACTGQWLADDTFVLRINLVGGINCYELKLTFPAQAGKVDVHLIERTGLNEEHFSGVVAE